MFVSHINDEKFSCEVPSLCECHIIKFYFPKLSVLIIQVKWVYIYIHKLNKCWFSIYIHSTFVYQIHIHICTTQNNVLKWNRFKIIIKDLFWGVVRCVVINAKYLQFKSLSINFTHQRISKL